jgi:hypothetical protein
MIAAALGLQPGQLVASEPLAQLMLPVLTGSISARIQHQDHTPTTAAHHTRSSGGSSTPTTKCSDRMAKSYGSPALPSPR